MKYIGILIPETNTIVEHEIIRMLSEDKQIFEEISVHFSRIEVKADYAKNDVEFLEEVYRNREKACQLLKTIPVDILGFFCNSAIVLQKSKGLPIANLINGIPVINPFKSMLEASKIIKPTRALLVSPYSGNVAGIVENAFTQQGISVSKSVFLSLKTDIDKYTLNQTKELIIENTDDNIDLILISCTNFRTLELINSFESEFDIPIISSNQSMVWKICREIKIKHQGLSKYGRIFNLK